jgi:hypothetical protein
LEIVGAPSIVMSSERNHGKRKGRKKKMATPTIKLSQLSGGR